MKKMKNSFPVYCGFSTCRPDVRGVWGFSCYDSIKSRFLDVLEEEARWVLWMKE